MTPRTMDKHVGQRARQAVSSAPGTRNQQQDEEWGVMYTDRRAFLKLGSLAAASGLVTLANGASSRQLTTTGPTRKVLIVGAGLAGLVAGYELGKLGHDVIILEAQLRPGGRVYTLRDFSDGLYAEAGASRIPSNHDLTLRYVEEFKLPLAPFYPPGGT